MADIVVWCWQVLRSKGFIWMAGNDVMSGEWSQAGTILRMSCGGPWFAAIPREAWNVEDVRPCLAGPGLLDVLGAWTRLMP